MESATQQPARRPVESPAAERRKEELEAREAANRETVEAMSSPEEPTPTQAEADAMKEGVAQGGAADAQRVEREQSRQRDQRPAAQPSGYQTR